MAIRHEALAKMGTETSRPITRMDFRSIMANGCDGSTAAGSCISMGIVRRSRVLPRILAEGSKGVTVLFDPVHQLPNSVPDANGGLPAEDRI